MCWNSKRHNDHNYFAISGHSASQKYVTSPSVASKSIPNLLIKSHQNHHNHFVTTWSSSSGETWKGRWRSWTCWRARSCCSCTRRMTTGGARCASSLNSKSLIPQRENLNKLFFWQFIPDWVEIDSCCGRLLQFWESDHCNWVGSFLLPFRQWSSFTGVFPQTANCSQSLPH